MRFLAWITTLAACLAFLPAAEAASLRVSPVLLDMKAPQAATSISIWNDAQQPINVQVRVFRWSQKDGADVYTPATDVVASPPITTLKAGGENIVRIVRTTKQAIQAEESYRLIVDELPDPARRQGGTVTLVLRHSIPVFFSKAEPATATPQWSVQQKPGGFQVTVTNSGAKRFKVSNLSLASGKTALAKRDGLLGYALGKSTVSWFVPGNRLSGRSVTISADSEAGRIDATASVNGG
jgi:fimbrial chaperone protein